MEMIVLLLSSISGALIGTSVGIYLLYRKLRPITGAELDLTRGKLRSTEFSLSAANANLENLKKQMEAREQQFSLTEEKLRVLETQVAEQENKVKDETKAVAESASRQIASYEAQIDADDRQIKEFSAQVARVSAELEQIRTDFAEETKIRTNLEAQLTTEHDHSRRLASRIAELESERSHFDLTLQEERQSAAKGIELLLMAQQNLARVFRPAAPEAPEAPVVPVQSNGQELVEVAAAVAAGSSVS